MGLYKFSKTAHIQVKVEVEAGSIEEALDAIETEQVSLDNYSGNGGNDRLAGVDGYDTIEASVEIMDDVIEFTADDLDSVEDGENDDED